MSTFIKKILLLLVSLIVIDRLGAIILEKMFYSQHHGDDYVSIQTIKDTTADVLIMGSSRASHHYNCAIIEKLTGLNTYNGGRDMMGIHYVEAILPIRFKAHPPKVLVLDIMPNNFCKGGQDGQKYFDILHNTLLPFANKYPSIMDYIKTQSSITALQAKACASYAYNSMVGTMFQNTFTHLGHQQVKGYEPIYSAIDSLKLLQPLFNENNLQDVFDTSSFQSLINILEVCKQNNTRVIVVFSPFYFQRKVLPSSSIKFNALQQQYGFKLLDYTNNANYTQHAKLFYDELHLNDTGAGLLSKEVSAVIK
jgi:hypothetical protein